MTGYLSASCPENKTSGLTVAGDQNSPLADTDSFATPVMGLAATRTGVDIFHPKPTTSASKNMEKEEEEWHVVSRVIGKSRTMGSQSPEAPRTKNTCSLIPSTRRRMLQLHPKPIR